MRNECAGVSSDNLIFSWYLVTLTYLHFSVAADTARETKTRGMFYDITAKFLFFLWYIAHQFLGFCWHSKRFNLKRERLKTSDKIKRQNSKLKKLEKSNSATFDGRMERFKSINSMFINDIFTKIVSEKN